MLGYGSIMFNTFPYPKTGIFTVGTASAMVAISKLVTLTQEITLWGPRQFLSALPSVSNLLASAVTQQAEFALAGSNVDR